MIVMNPYHAHESPVGYVFDVAKWSPRKSFITGLFGIVLGAVLAVATVYAWDPHLFPTQSLVKELPKSIQQPVRSSLRDLNAEIKRLHRKHPQGMLMGVGFAGFTVFLFTAAGVAFFADSRYEDKFFLRAGPGGISFRVPNGIDFGKLCFGSKTRELHLPWDDIQQWQVIQRKQFGAISPNAGNLDATLKITMQSGKKHRISLDDFRQPARIIYKRIQEATEMMPAQLESSDSCQSAENLAVECSAPFGKYSTPQQFPKLPIGG